MNLVLETLTSELTRVGEYVNVIGYISSRINPSKSEAQEREPALISIQALLIWSTGPMDVQKYEQTFKKPE